MSPLLVADCVSKSFRGRRILSAASLRAVSGELRVLLGLNGAGKSTLLKIAAGWIQPDSGSVRFGETAYLTAHLPQLAEAGLFYVPDRDLFSSAFSVRTQLEMIRRQFDGWSVESAAEQVGLVARLLDRQLHQLSGGERRRLEIAAILVRRPRCVLADEPFRGVAPRDAEAMTRLLKDVAAAGIAVVVTGQEAPTLLAAADHVTWCTAGTTYELGPPASAVLHESFRREYLGATDYQSAVMGAG